MPSTSSKALRREIDELRVRLAEAEDTINAIRQGAVDAIVVSSEGGTKVFSLTGAEQVYRRVFETMHEAALTTTTEGRILSCNPQFAQMVRRPIEEVVGRSALDFVQLHHQEALRWLLQRAQEKPVKFRIEMAAAEGAVVPAQVAASRLDQPEGPCLCLVATDLTELESSTAMLRQVREQEAELRGFNAELERRVAERTVEVQRQADHLRALAVELSQAEQRERRRLASVLHDHLQQLLVSAKMQLALVKRGNPQTFSAAVERIDAALGEAIDASRSLTVELSPPVLHQEGLAAALAWLGNRMEEKHLFKVHVQAGRDAEPASPEMRVFLFEATREMLLNAVKHSGTREARVRMQRAPDAAIHVIIEDQGKGFDPAAVKPGSSGGFGLFSIQQRLAYLGGRLRIDSAPGRGTRATLAIPGETTATA